MPDEALKSGPETENETETPEGKAQKRQLASDSTPLPEAMEVEMVPGFKVKAMGMAGNREKGERGNGSDVAKGWFVRRMKVRLG